MQMHTHSFTPLHTVSLTDTSHTHTHTHTHSDTNAHPHSLTPLHTISLSHTLSYKCTHTHTHRNLNSDTNVQVHRQTVSHTQSHTETSIQRLKCTAASIPSQSHTHTMTQMHSCIQTLSLTHKHCLMETHTVTQMHRCTHSDTNAVAPKNTITHRLTHTQQHKCTHTHYTLTHWEWQKHPTDHQLWYVSRIAWRRPAWGWWDWSAPPLAPGSCGTSKAAATRRCGWLAARLPGICPGSSACQNVNACINTGALVQVSFPAVTLDHSYLPLVSYPSLPGLIPCLQAARTCAGPFRSFFDHVVTGSGAGIFCHVTVWVFHKSEYRQLHSGTCDCFLFSLFCPVSGVSFYYPNCLLVLFISNFSFTQSSCPISQVFLLSFTYYTIALSCFVSVFSFT